MSLYSEALDLLAGTCADRLALSATRDPDLVGTHLARDGLVVFVQFPTHVDRLMGGANLEVPVSLLAPAPAGIVNLDALLERYDDFVDVVGSRLVSVGPIDVGAETYPAITATAQITVTTP
jgi:hypothetical protein